MWNDHDVQPFSLRYALQETGAGKDNGLHIVLCYLSSSVYSNRWFQKVWTDDVIKMVNNICIWKNKASLFSGDMHKSLSKLRLFFRATTIWEDSITDAYVSRSHDVLLEH